MGLLSAFTYVESVFVGWDSKWEIMFSHRPSRYSASGESSKMTDSMECETLLKIAPVHSDTHRPPVIME